MVGIRIVSNAGDLQGRLYVDMIWIGADLISRPYMDMMRIGGDEISVAP